MRHWLQRFHVALSSAKLLFACVSATTFIFFSAFFSWMIADQTLHWLATTADGLRQYELAENLYKLNPQRDKNFSSSAVWRSSNQVESENVKLARDGAVAKIYGLRSVEMARRYRFLAFNLDQHNRITAAEQRGLFERARDIYHQHGLHGRCSDMFIQCALTFDKSDVQKELFFLRNAADELSRDQQVEMPWTPSLAAFMAKSSGDEQLSSRFHLYDLKCQRSHASEPDPLMLYLAYTCIALLAISAMAKVGVGRRTYRELAALCLYSQVERSLQRASDPDATLDGYNVLIDIDVSRRDFASALDNSAKALTHYGVAVPQYQALKSPSIFRRWIGIVRDEVAALILVWTFVVMYVT
jgi:hypothetical protein